MKSLTLAALGLLLSAQTAGAICHGLLTDEKNIYVAGKTQLRWCWEEVSGGTGSVYYEVETSTNGSAWLYEGVTDIPEWSLAATMGDKVILRYRACDDVECTDYSPDSQPVKVYPDYDADGDGLVGSRDFNAFRAWLDPTTLKWFRNVFGSQVVAGVYMP